jgi:hypothetical protein
MVKSLRYDQANSPDGFWLVVVGSLWRAGHANSYADCYGYPAPDRDTAPDSHADACVDLPTAESRGGVDAARSI